MPKRGNTDARRGSTPEEQFDWFKTAASHAGSCDQWDIKTATLAEAVLGLLSLGRAVMFGSSRDGGSISVTIYDGENKARSWVADAIEFDDLMEHLARRVEERRAKEPGPHLRAVGD